MTVRCEKTATGSGPNRLYVDSSRLLYDDGGPTRGQRAIRNTEGACRVGDCTAAAARGASRMRQEGRVSTTTLHLAQAV